MKYKIKLFLLFLIPASFSLFLHVKCSEGYLSLFRDMEEPYIPPEEEPYTWPKRIGGISEDAGFGLASDSINNIIITGYVTGSVDFNNDGDIADEFETSSDATTDIFIIKHSARGTFKWAKRLGGLSDDKGYAAATDSLDNIIVTGFVTGDADLNCDGDYGEEGEATGIYGAKDIFIVIFDPSGTFLRSKRLGGISNDEGQSVVVDGSDNIIVTGIIRGDADINGNGAIDIGLPETATATYGSSDIFVSKFDSSVNNIWIKRLGGSDTLFGEVNSSVAADSADNIIVSGTVSLSADLNSDDDKVDGIAENATGTNHNLIDIFITKFDNSTIGVWQWAIRLGGDNADYNFGITTDTSNNVIITGNVYQGADLDGDGTASSTGAEDATAYGDYDIFISKFNSGGSWQWAGRLGGVSADKGSYDNGSKITVAPDNDIIVAGEVYGNADLNCDGDSIDGGAEDSALYGNNDIFISKFDSSGIWQWAKRLGGTDADGANNIIVSNSNVFVTGYVTGNADLDGDGVIVLQTAESSSYGGKDVIISVLTDQ